MLRAFGHRVAMCCDMLSQHIATGRPNVLSYKSNISAFFIFYVILREQNVNENQIRENLLVCLANFWNNCISFLNRSLNYSI